MAAIRSASCSMMSSSVCAPGKNARAGRGTRRDVRVAAGEPLLEELVEVADHLAVGARDPRGSRSERVRHAAHELVEHLLAQLLERARRSARGRPAPGSRTPRARGSGRRRRAAARRAGRGAWRPCRGASRSAGSTARRRSRGGARRIRARVGCMPRRVEALLDPGSLLGDDRVELAPDVGQRRRRACSVEQLLAAPCQPVHQVAQARPCRRACCRASASRAP